MENKMFEAFVLACVIGSTQLCHTLEDLEGPYKTEKECVDRAYEIKREIPDYLPNYYALKYKCNKQESEIQL